MTAKTMGRAVGDIMKGQKVTQSQLAKRMGYSSPQAVWNGLHRKRAMPTNKALSFLRELGFVLMAVPHSARMNDGVVEIAPGGDQ